MARRSLGAYRRRGVRDADDARDDAEDEARLDEEARERLLLRLWLRGTNSSP